MFDHLKPDYQGGSIVNLMSSITGALGASSTEIPPTNLVSTDSIEQANNILFFVVDGMGYNFISSQSEDSFLKQHLQGALTSVFPSTTATAITSYFTAKTPLQHGLTGWYMYLKEADDIVTVLPFKPRGSPVWKRMDESCKELLYSFESVFETIDVPSWVVSPNNIVNSVYSLVSTKNATRVGYEGLDDLFVQAKQIILTNNAKEKTQQQFTYCYWPGFDATCHSYGVGSAEALSIFQEFESAFCKLMDELKGTNTTVIVSADHGFIDTSAERIILLEDHPELQDTLRLPLCGEPRACYCYVNSKKTALFEAYITNHFSDYCWMYKSEDLIQQGLFGFGQPHPGFHERVGDYVLVMKENYVLKDTLDSEKPFTQIGVHGGLSADELYVPLIILSV